MSEQLANYISEQISAGVSTGKIKAVLKASGWKDEAVLDALAALKGESPDPEQPSKVWLYAGVVMILLALAGVGVYASGMLSGPQSTSVQLTPPSQVPVEQMEADAALSEADMYGEMEPPILIEESTSSAQSMSMGTDYTKLMSTLAEELPTCTPHIMSFTHFFDGKTYTKEIAGMTEKGCHYIETMPNGGKYECYFSELQRNELSQAIVANMESYSQSSEGTFSMSYSSTESASTSTDPWQQVYNDPATCTLNGY